MTSRHTAELARIRADYARRDAEAAEANLWQAPGYRFHVFTLEMALLSALDRAGIRLQDSDVLEVGCGSGYYTNRLLEFGARRAVGVDLLESRIAVAQERYPRPEFLAADAADLPFADGSFDVAVQITCLSAILDEEIRRRAAHEMWRVVRPGGLLLSWDMRPVGAVQRAGGRALARLPGAARQDPNGAVETAIAPLGPEEFRRLFPSAAIRTRPAALHLTLAGVSQRSPLTAELAMRIPMLRTHLLAEIRKPSV